MDITNKYSVVIQKAGSEEWIEMYAGNDEHKHTLNELYDELVKDTEKGLHPDIMIIELDNVEAENAEEALDLFNNGNATFLDNEFGEIDDNNEVDIEEAE